MKYSEKIEKLSNSLTIAFSTKTKELINNGIPVLDLTVGEPDFDTPEYIKKAGIEAISKGYTRYTPSNGTIELKKEICKKFLKDNNINYCPENIIVSTGAKQSILNALIAICNKDDEVLIPSPYWVSYPEMTKIADGTPIIVETKFENSFKVTVEDLDKYLTDKSKVVIITNPSNPTGSVYSKKELTDIANWALKNNILIISDEIYERLNYIDKHFSIASISEEIKNITITISGFSKSYAMTGWRLGYCAANTDLITLMGKIQSHSTSCANSIAQYAGYIALKDENDEINIMINEFKKRANLVYTIIKNSKYLDMINPSGAFYGFISVEYMIGKTYNNKKINNASDVTSILLNDYQVSVLPGIAFGNDNYIRISYATDKKTIEKALNKLVLLSNTVI